MIRDVEGDILLSKAAAIAHGVAPSDHFDSGLALALRERFPAMVRDFRHHCQQKSPKPGEAWAWAGVDRDGGAARVISLLTQEPAPSQGARPGRASLPNVNHALRALARLVAEEKLSSIALPRLATGVGGLDWADVRPLIQTQLGGLGIPVLLYAAYRPGQAADERLG